MKSTGKKSEILVERPVYEIEELNEIYKYEKPLTSCKSNLVYVGRSLNPVRLFKGCLPILYWLPSYKWRLDGPGDFLAGLTLSVLQIPQCMACAMLNDVPTIHGMYTGIFPVLIYFFFGTSRHLAVGSFMLNCLLTGKVVNEHATVFQLSSNVSSIVYRRNPSLFTEIDIAQTVTFTVAIIQLALYLLRFGIISNLLSDTLVKGLTSGAAFQIANSQLRDLFGLTIKKRNGIFAIPLTIYDLITKFQGVNLLAIGISSITCTILFLHSIKLKPWLAKRTRIPFPSELIVVIIVTTCSKYMDFNGNYHLTIVGKIRTGLPEMTIPNFNIMPHIITDSFIICLISYTVSISLALMYAKKFMYEVDCNQELLAMGLSNMVGSIFLCLPISGSLSRTALRSNAGGTTQISGLVCAGVMLITILWIAPVFETLPTCVLASIIVVALREMFINVKLVSNYWRLNRWDATIWLVTFLVTVIVQITYGLAAGIIVSFIVMYIQGHKSYSCILGVVPNTDLYLDIERYKAAIEIDGIKIFHYSGGLNFVLFDSFKHLLFSKTKIDPLAIQREQAKKNRPSVSVEDLKIKCFVIDFSSLTFIDPTATDFLRSLKEDYECINISILFVGCSGPVFEMMANCERITKTANNFLIFSSIHDAVLYAQINIVS